MRNNIFQIAKAVLASVLVSLLFVLIFTLVIQIFTLPMDAVKPVNQVFKIVAIAVGGLLFIRGEKGLIKGLIHGAVSVVVTYLVFSLISWTFSLSWMFLLELLIGAAAGGISGIIAVNIKKNA